MSGTWPAPNRVEPGRAQEPPLPPARSSDAELKQVRAVLDEQCEVNAVLSQELGRVRGELDVMTHERDEWRDVCRLACEARDAARLEAVAVREVGVAAVEEAVTALDIEGLTAHDVERVARVACAPLHVEIDRVRGLIGEAIEVAGAAYDVETLAVEISRIRREAGIR